MENSRDKREPRQNRGTRTLDENYVWPPSFGTPLPKKPDTSRKPHTEVGSISSGSKIEEVSNDLRADFTKAVEEKNDIENNSVATSKTNKTAKSMTNKTKTTKSKRSTTEIELEYALIALQAEERKRQIEEEFCEKELERGRKQKERERKQEEREKKQKEEALKLLELKQKVEQLKIRTKSTTKSCKTGSVSKHFDVLSQNSDESYTKKWINKNQEHFLETSKSTVDRKPDITEVCDKIASAIQAVATPRQAENTPDRRHLVEKDFPFYDGKPEEWPTFIYQFRQISTICKYTNEECLIKLQKCLKGDAKKAVSGLLMSPGNLNQVIHTLEKRFGRPDLILDILINKAKSFLQIREYELENLISFSSSITSIVSTITSLNYDRHLENPSLLKDLVQNLPNTLKLRWGEEVSRKNGQVNLLDFSEWVAGIADSACYVTTPKISPPAPSLPRKHEKSFIINDQVAICGYCHEKHLVENCRKIKTDDVETRWQVVTKNKLCFSCLKGSHQTRDCKKRQQCNVQGCKRQHNKMLHNGTATRRDNSLVTTTESRPSGSRTEPTTQPGQGFIALGQNKESKNVLLRMVNVKITGPDNCTIYTTALFDECSTVTLIDENLVQKLNINGTSQPLTLQWTNDVTSTHETSKCYDLKISGDYPGAEEFEMRNVRSIKNLALPLQVVLYEDFRHLPHIQGLPISDITCPPMLLIGQDNAKLTVPRKVIEGPEGSPIATKTKLGWTIHGKIDNTTNQHGTTFHICEKEIEDDQLHQLVKKSFTNDAISERPQRQVEIAHGEVNKNNNKVKEDQDKIEALSEMYQRKKEEIYRYKLNQKRQTALEQELQIQKPVNDKSLNNSVQEDTEKLSSGYDCQKNKELSAERQKKATKDLVQAESLEKPTVMDKLNEIAQKTVEIGRRNKTKKEQKKIHEELKQIQNSLPSLKGNPKQPRLDKVVDHLNEKAEIGEKSKVIIQQISPEKKTEAPVNVTPKSLSPKTEAIEKLEPSNRCDEINKTAQSISLRKKKTPIKKEKKIIIKRDPSKKKPPLVLDSGKSLTKFKKVPSVVEKKQLGECEVKTKEDQRIKRDLEKFHRIKTEEWGLDKRKGSKTLNRMTKLSPVDAEKQKQEKSETAKEKEVKVKRDQKKIEKKKS